MSTVCQALSWAPPPGAHCSLTTAVPGVLFPLEYEAEGPCSRESEGPEIQPRGQCRACSDAPTRGVCSLHQAGMGTPRRFSPSLRLHGSQPRFLPVSLVVTETPHHSALTGQGGLSQVKGPTLQGHSPGQQWMKAENSGPDVQWEDDDGSCNSKA